MTQPDPDAAGERAQRLATWSPLRGLTDLVHTVADIWRLTDENRDLADEHRIILMRLESQMADTSPLLNEVATALRDRVFPAVTDVLAENKTLREENASLKGEDVRESTAAQAVKTEADAVAGLFTDSPDAPDVDPLPEPPADTPTA